MVEKEFVRRTGECRVKLAPDMMSRLDAIALAHGFPVATMAAVAVAEWVNTKEQSAKNQKLMLMDMGRQLSGEVGKLFADLAADPDALQASADLVSDVQARRSTSSDGPGAVGG